MMESSGNGAVVFRGHLLTLLTRRETGPDGAEHTYEIVEHPPAVAIVAVRRPSGQEPRIAMVRQQRPAVGGETWELPAGLAHGDESLESAARRELREEAAAEGADWTELGRVYAAPGFTDARITIFLADNVTTIAGATPDPAEISSVTWVPLSEAIKQVEAGGDGDAKTSLGVLLARDRLTGGAREGRDEKDGTMFTPDSPMPFAAPERVESTGGPDPSLHLENLLLQEYAYASSTAYQALEDRARMFNLYLVLVGALATGVGVITQLGGKLGGYSAEVIIALLVVMGVVGIAFFIKLIRLRQAWRESAIAMNVIKEHYIKIFAKSTPNIAQMFRWRMRTLPVGERYTSISFVVCMTVALLASLSFAAGALMAVATWLTPFVASIPGQNDLALALPWIIAILVTLLSFALHLWYFSHALNREKERASLRNAVTSAGLSESIL